MKSLFTDGACSSNPGPGGWAVVFKDGKTISSLSGFELDTTNNKMELKAAIEAYKKILALKISNLRDKTEYEIVSDSAYVVNAFVNDWLSKWEANDWRNGKGERVKNVGLWKEFFVLKKMADSVNLTIKFRKVRGHAGNSMNELADSIAVSKKIEAINIAEESNC